MSQEVQNFQTSPRGYHRNRCRSKVSTPARTLPVQTGRDRPGTSLHSSSSLQKKQCTTLLNGIFSHLRVGSGQGRLFSQGCGQPRNPDKKFTPPRRTAGDRLSSAADGDHRWTSGLLVKAKEGSLATPGGRCPVCGWMSPVSTGQC